MARTAIILLFAAIIVRLALPVCVAIAEAIIALAKVLNIRAIAEGVENEAQAAFLQSKGCHEAQGYLYSRPLPVEKIVEIWPFG
jgi:EAL domain-containing protein (putative c-di-GMP-specific phosphodiesterase class I)